MALLRPSDAGRAIGIKPSTLRVYAQRFADLLSDDAVARDRPGHRLYTAHDVALLRRAREYLDRGLTYERAAEELKAQAQTGRASPSARRESPARARSSDSGPEHTAAMEQASGSCP